MIIRRYSELKEIDNFEDRYHYLRVRGNVGESTFGFERYLNQRFYTSREWRLVRKHVIARDLGNDLGFEGYPIHDKIIIHHMNPMRPENIIHNDSDILNEEFLICVSHSTHNAIHYGDASLLPRDYVPRFRGDTKLW